MEAPLTDLIQRLNALSALTPDEIATRLKTNGWLLPSELGQERFDRDKATVPYIYCQVRTDGSRGTMSETEDAHTAWKMRQATNNYAEFVTRLETNSYLGAVYWVIPLSEYTGEPPPCTT